jgi:heterodisulfide reductase subunit C
MFNIKVGNSMSKLDTRLLQITGSERNQYCHQCGKCSSGCPAADFFDFRPRKIVAMVQLGMIDELLSSEVIWHCAQCLLCKERCPRDAGPADVIQALQNLAYILDVHVPEGYPVLINSILKNGVVQTPIKVRVWKELPTKDAPRREFEFRDRLALGLPQLKKPADIQKLADALQEVLKWKKE